MILDWKTQQNKKSIPRSCGTPPHPVRDVGAVWNIRPGAQPGSVPGYGACWDESMPNY